jgi:hypothetical protein
MLMQNSDASCREITELCSAVIARLDRAIQYSETPEMQSKSYDVLDTPHMPGMTAAGGICDISFVIASRGATTQSSPYLSPWIASLTLAMTRNVTAR